MKFSQSMSATAVVLAAGLTVGAADAQIAIRQNPAPRPASARSISELLAPRAQSNTTTGGPAPAAPAEPPAPKPAPPSFEVRARPTIDLTTVQLRPADEALILKTLDGAASHGFRRNEFAAPDLAQRLASEDSAVRTAAEHELKVGLLHYARAQHGQRIPVEAFQKNWGVRPEPYNPDRSFAAAVADDKLAAWIDDLPPPFPGYQSLRKALDNYRDIAAKGGWDKVPGGPTLKMAATGPRVLALRARLAMEDAQLAASTTPELFEAGLAEAVMRYQLRNGLNPTGTVDRFTFSALNQPVGQRVSQIIANLERWRWIDRDLPADRIEVNIAAAGMSVYRDNHPVLSMRAVAGRPTDQTPMLQSRVESIVINPPWNVPSSIAQKELWPKERLHPGYLEAHGFRVLTDDKGAERLQQKAGPSALGKLKFDFPNNYGVYLHDTPSHSTFATDTRAVSHGCVRLQHPADLAKLLLEPDPDWAADVLSQAIDSGDTKRVKLKTAMPVVILYWTAYVAGGQVSFRPDIYDWDEALLGLIDASRSLPNA